jgi:glycosyltransferase involved in cell wall biosynthesis
MKADRARVVVLGMMANVPAAGHTWLHLNWLRGIQMLGHEVWFVEDELSWPYDPVQGTRTDDYSYTLAYIRSCLERINLEDHWAFRVAERRGNSWGLSDDELDDLYASCDVLINLEGSTELRDVHMAAPLRVLVETDPAGDQLKIANGDADARRVYETHHVRFTYGENYGAPDCEVPLDGLNYLKTRQPVDLELWPMAYTPDAELFTTMGAYRQHGREVEYQGKLWTWSKHHEWERYIELPQRTSQRFQLALAGYEDADRIRLESHGWRVIPVEPLSDDLGAFGDYMRNSRGEFTVVKEQYYKLRTGWFSERAASYLASGKPVVTQATGFENVLPTGEGLFAVSTSEEAAAAIEEINGDYRRHCRAARAIAEEHFEASKVAGRMFAELGFG